MARDLLFVVYGLLIVVASLAAPRAQALGAGASALELNWGSVAVAHGLGSCSPQAYLLK